MQFSLHIQQIKLPNGPMPVWVPVDSSVEAVYRNLLNQTDDLPFPFWARLWPSAIALSAFIQHQSHWIAGRKVAELAAGIGLPSLVSAPFAEKVWCTDLIPDAAGVAAKNAEMLGLTNFEAMACSWEHFPEYLQPEVLLLSDVNYQPEVFDSLFSVIQSFLEKGTTILLATPQRLMAKPFIEKLLPYVVEQSVEEGLSTDQTAIISIFVMQKR